MKKVGTKAVVSVGTVKATQQETGGAVVNRTGKAVVGNGYEQAEKVVGAQEDIEAIAADLQMKGRERMKAESNRTETGQDTVTAVELSDKEKVQLLEKNEEVIAGDVKAFIRTGKVLEEIRRLKLYTVTHRKEFGVYCREKWSIS
ncbi:MAG: hypothetical protein WCN95_08030, partial [bacterium]